MTLRAARWVRESTEGQYDRFGPDAQRELADRAIEANGWLDTGIAWQVAHSGGTVHESAEWRDMLTRAGHDYDVLVVGYASRFARNVEEFARAVRLLREAGASVYFADERLHTADEQHWDWWMREAVEAESYRRRLARRIREGYAAKYRRFADPGGNPPYGFRRRREPPYLMEPDPETIDRAVEVFRRYATDTISTDALAVEMGLGYEQVQNILNNPIYNGWACRGRPVKGKPYWDERVPAAWRSNPPVPDWLWEQVQAIKARRLTGGGPHRSDRHSLLAGLLQCVCGANIRRNGTQGGAGKGPIRFQFIHPKPLCDEWGSRLTYPAETWEPWIVAQVDGIRLDEDRLSRVRAIIAAQQQPDDIARFRVARRRREIALAYAEGKMGRTEFDEQLAALDIEEAHVTSTRDAELEADLAVERLRSIPLTWERGTDEERAAILRGIYSKITVRGPDIVKVELTPAAYAVGLAVALPSEVRLIERPRQEPGTRVQPASVNRSNIRSVSPPDRSSRRSHTRSIPIVGRPAWLAAARAAWSTA